MTNTLQCSGLSEKCSSINQTCHPDSNSNPKKINPSMEEVISMLRLKWWPLPAERTHGHKERSDFNTPPPTLLQGQGLREMGVYILKNKLFFRLFRFVDAPHGIKGAERVCWVRLDFHTRPGTFTVETGFGDALFLLPFADGELGGVLKIGQRLRNGPRPASWGGGGVGERRRRSVLRRGPWRTRLCHGSKALLRGVGPRTAVCFGGELGLPIRSTAGSLGCAWQGHAGAGRWASTALSDARITARLLLDEVRQGRDGLWLLAWGCHRHLSGMVRPSGSALLTLPVDVQAPHRLLQGVKVDRTQDNVVWTGGGWFRLWDFGFLLKMGVLHKDVAWGERQRWWT